MVCGTTYVVDVVRCVPSEAELLPADGIQGVGVFIIQGQRSFGQKAIRHQTNIVTN